MILSKRKPEPWRAFPGMIEYEPMTDDQIWGALDAWVEGVDDECEPEG